LSLDVNRECGTAMATWVDLSNWLGGIFILSFHGCERLSANPVGSRLADASLRPLTTVGLHPIATDRPIAQSNG
jgi:hypothetical protein